MGFDAESLGLSDSAVGLLRDLVHERTGVFYDDNRRDVLADRLAGLVTEGGFQSFLDYYYFLKYDPAAPAEWGRVMDAMAVPETYLWREVDQLKAVASVIVPELSSRPSRGPIRIWCAPCASGEEPLTLAMLLDDGSWFDRTEIELYASDGSPAAIEKARRGRYRERSFRVLPPHVRERYFTRRGDEWEIDRRLHGQVRSWSVVNIGNRSEVEPRAGCDVLLCRNLFIYFSPAAVRETVSWFADLMATPGYLCVGASESLLRVTRRFELEEIAGAFVYVKRHEAPGEASGMNIVRVLVVDDSAYVRKVVKQMLVRSPFIEVVGTARDGVEALEQVAELNPDVVTCDLNMPQMDGTAFVRAQMERRPVPIIIISVASHAGEAVLAALDAGAIDFVQKPTALATDKLLDIADELVEKVKAAAQAPLRHGLPVVSALPPIPPVATVKGRVDIVLIGTSTGGPQALKVVIPRLPANFPVPIGLVLHMPIGYTETYAEKLNEMSALTVVEAKGNEKVVPGLVFLAPAGRHLTFRRDADGSVRTALELRPLDTPHRPSVDVMFRSAAMTFGAAVLGVVMTGMGADGREGAAWIKANGGQIVTEAEETCVVYGMPRSVVEAGLSDEVVAVDRVAEVIMERV